MTAPILQPTPHPEVNMALHQLLTNMQATLGDQLVGLYLGGSLALGDFDHQRSDIDFVAVTAGELSPERIDALREMHSRLRSTGTKWAGRLDGSYVPQSVFRHWTADHPPSPFVEGESLILTQQGSAVIQRHILHQHGVVVTGPSLATLLDPVDRDELHSALREMLAKWWWPLLADPAWLQQRSKQPFAILTLCRTIYALEQGKVASKPVAARWCQQRLGQEWSGVIEWALTTPYPATADHLATTLRLIQYTLDRYQQSS